MNRMDISQAISLIDFKYIDEAMEVENVLLNESKKRKYKFIRISQLAACISLMLIIVSLAAMTAFAVNDSFREAVISLLYPLYSTDEIKSLDDGHMTGAFDETDTLLSFLEWFNAEKPEFGVQAENQAGYTYNMLSDSPDTILAVVKCNISNYKILVTIKKLDYEETTGIWQVVSYQMITNETASELIRNIPEYVSDLYDQTEVVTDGMESVIEATGTSAVIYNANHKDNIISLTEQESRQIKEMFAEYTISENIIASDLQDMVIKYEDVMYAFSKDGNVVVMKGAKVGISHGQIILSSEDLEKLLGIFEDSGLLY